MRTRAPPVVWLALAYGLGSTTILLGASLPSAPALLVLLFLIPIRLLRSPGTPSASFFFAVLAGAAITFAWKERQRSDCRWELADGQEVEVVGFSLAAPGDGPVELSVEEGLPRACRAVVRMVLQGSGQTMRSGVPMRVSGRWRATRRPDITRPDRSGYLAVERVAALSQGAGGGWSAGRWLAWGRGGLEERISALFPVNGGLVRALVLARKEGLDDGLREAFAVAGTAHLLAISGFHVGVVAALLLGVLRGCGLSRRWGGTLAALGVWGYVAGIGLPDAATRAAIMFSLLMIGRLRTRPVAGLGSLSTAFLLLLLLDPGALGRPGFQLSFTGATGLLLMARSLERWLGLRTGGRCPRALSGAVAAGVSATLATLPLVAWHFDRVSLVGIPATILAGPLVALAIPGIFASLALDVVHHGGAGFLAGGVDLLLTLLTELVEGFSRLPFASIWIPRSWVVAGSVGGVGGAFVLLRGVRASRRIRRLVVVGSVVAGIIGVPGVEQVARRDVLEIVFLDVGQGDAIALRSPRGRWVLVDAGPRGREYDTGRSVIVPFLRDRSVSRLEILLLTHSDMDHIGGAETVLGAVEVGAIMDPGLPTGKSAYVSLLEKAAADGVPWRLGRRGESIILDGMHLEILGPGDLGRIPGEGPDDGEEPDANASSLVTMVRYGSFEALLTGDAPVEAEERSIEGLEDPDVEVLKVGHHGSTTSTSPFFLQRTRPEVAVISVGRGNRFGHPHSRVLEDLRRSGSQIFRTDVNGAVRVLAREDGSFRVIPGRAGV